MRGPPPAFPGCELAASAATETKAGKTLPQAGGTAHQLRQPEGPRPRYRKEARCPAATAHARHADKGRPGNKRRRDPDAVTRPRYRDDPGRRQHRGAAPRTDHPRGEVQRIFTDTHPRARNHGARSARPTQAQVSTAATVLKGGGSEDAPDPYARRQPGNLRPGRAGTGTAGQAQRSYDSQRGTGCSLTRSPAGRS